MSAHKPFFLLAASAVFVTSACAAREEPRTETTTTVTTTTVTAQGTVDLPPDFKVEDVDLGRGLDSEKKIINLTDDFSPTDTISVSVRTSGAVKDAKVTARWMKDTVLVHEQSETVTTSGESRTTFSVWRSTPWARGEYKLVVLVNGREMDTEDFEVK